MASIAIPLAISGISALSGLFANQKKQQQQQQTQRAVTDIDELSMPEYDPQTLAMRNYLMDSFLKRTADNEDFFRGYRTQGLSNINQGADATQRAIDNILSSRGLYGTSAGVSSNIMGQQNRLNQQSQLLNQIPLLADQRAAENLGAASGFYSRIPLGTRRTGQNVTNTTGTSTATIPGNMLGGAFGGLANSLMGLYGEGAFGNPSGTTSRGYRPSSGIDYNILGAPGYQLPGVKY